MKIIVAPLLVYLSVPVGWFSDSAADAFISRCEKVSTGGSSECKCVASVVKDVLGSEYWRILGLIGQGKEGDAQVELAKIGFSAPLTFATKYQMALSAAEAKCGVRNLSRM